MRSPLPLAPHSHSHSHSHLGDKRVTDRSNWNPKCSVFRVRVSNDRVTSFPEEIMRGSPTPLFLQIVVYRVPIPPRFLRITDLQEFPNTALPSLPSSPSPFHRSRASPANKRWRRGERGGTRLHSITSILLYFSTSRFT